MLFYVNKKKKKKGELGEGRAGRCWPNFLPNFVGKGRKKKRKEEKQEGRQKGIFLLDLKN